MFFLISKFLAMNSFCFMYRFKLLVKSFRPVLPFQMNVFLLDVFRLFTFPVMTHSDT